MSAIGKDKQPQALQLLFEGARHSEIARQLNVSRQAVNMWAAEPETKDGLRELQAHVREAIARQSVPLISEAVQVVAEVMRQAESDGDRLKAANSILDRFGLGKGSTVQLTGADGGPVEVQAAPSISDVRTFLDKLPPSELRAALERAGDEE